MNSIYILGHLGLGDHIVTNGLVRVVADRYDLVQVPCYLHNYESVAFMYRDTPKIQAVAIRDESDAVRLSQLNTSLRLGYYAPDTFNRELFDKEFYRHAGVNFSDRWDRFYVKPPQDEEKISHSGFVFVHEDAERGFLIDKSKVNSSKIIYPVKNGPIFNNLGLINSSSEIHCINSCFIILVDSLPDIPDQKLFIHNYCRVIPLPALKRNWTIL